MKSDHNRAVFFETPAELRRWLEANHETADELWIGLHRRATGRPSITWPQVVDEVLCFGWIDGIRKGIDADRYANRITPRRRGSNWSAVNVRRVQELVAEGRMTPAGLRAFEARDATRTPYSYETRPIVLDPAFEARFRENQAAWHWFEAQAPSYRRTSVYWVMSAKRAETRERRLATLIEDSANGRKVSPLA
jgi:uncharacterized protein YdeI (YjbR/CyaY-like superfamily)